MIQLLKQGKASVLTVVLSTMLALLLAEGLVRLFDWDWRFIEKILYYNTADLESHQPDPDPRFMFRLKPGQVYATTVNSLGFRGREYRAEKPAGVFRIVCVGGSNVYGATLNDDQTWPAQLEALLNKKNPGRYEVFNLGVSAYVGTQMVAMAEEALQKYDPDLIIYSLSNDGRRAFLEGSDVRYYFKKDPSLWNDVFPMRFFAKWSWLPQEQTFWLIENTRLVRLGLLAFLAREEEAHFWWSIATIQKEKNVEAIRAALTILDSRTCVFICPGCRNDNNVMYYSGINVPVIQLDAQGLPDEYRLIHPPGYVMTWYAEQLARELTDHGLLSK